MTGVKRRRFVTEPIETDVPGKGGKAENGSPLADLHPLVIICVFIPITLTMLFARVLFRGMTRNVTELYPMFPFIVYVLFNCLVITAGVSAFHRRLQWRDIGFCNFRWKDLSLGTAAAAAGVFIVYPAAMLLAGAIGLERMKGMDYSLNDPANIISAVLIASIIGPLAEDIIFRGFLLSFLREKYRRTWLTAAGGVLIFTSVHVFYFGWSGVLFILLWTPLSVGLFIWRKSIYPCLVLHMLNNITAYVLVPALLH